jgi:cell division protease FtsH
MVCEWGMSSEMGPLTFGKKEEQIFLGREIAQHQDYSEDTAVKIDQEVRRFVSENYTRAEEAILKHKDVLLKMADELLIREVLDGEQVRKIVQGEVLGAMPQPAGATAAVTEAPVTQETPAPQASSGLVPPTMSDPVPQQ